MVTSIYKKAFAVLRQKPVTLWGISLLCGLLELLAFIGFGAVPVGAFIVAWALEAGMAMIYLNSYRTGLKPKSTYLFAAFKKDRFWRVVGGLAWMELWILLWAGCMLIPAAVSGASEGGTSLLARLGSGILQLAGVSPPAFWAAAGVVLLVGLAATGVLSLKKAEVRL